LTPEQLYTRIQRDHADLNTLIELLGGPNDAIEEEDFLEEAYTFYLSLLKNEEEKVSLGTLFNRSRNQLMIHIASLYAFIICPIYGEL